MDFPDKNTGVGCHFLLQGYLPDPRMEPGSPVLQADSLLTEPPEKPSLVIYFIHSIDSVYMAIPVSQLFHLQFSSVQSLSRVQLFVTP